MLPILPYAIIWGQVCVVASATESLAGVVRLAAQRKHEQRGLTAGCAEQSPLLHLQLQ